MLEIGVGGFNTTYSVSGDINQPKEKMPCFARTLSLLYKDGATKSFKNNYSIYLFKEKKNMHCIFVSIEQMIEWFDLLKSIVPFEYSLEEYETDYILNVSITGPQIVHLFVLTGLRYVYEYPQSCLLLWSFKCKEEVTELKDVDLLTMVSVLRVFISSALCLGTGHIYPCVRWDGTPYKLVSKEILKSRFEEITSKKLVTFSTIPCCFDELFLQKTVCEIRVNNPALPYMLNRNENNYRRMYSVKYWLDYSNLQKEYPKIIELYKLLSSN